jgi:hypothetical protein
LDISLAEKFALNFALNVREASAVSRVCRTQLYLAMKAGELRAKKRGRTTLIMPTDLRDWLDSLPSFTPGGASEAEKVVGTPRAGAAG